MLRSSDLLAAAAAVVVVAAGALTSCTCKRGGDAAKSDGSNPQSQATDAASAAPEPKVVALYIWGNYIDPSLVQEFEKKTGIKVQESNYDSNEALLAKVQAGATGFDIAVPSDYMVTMMAGMGLLEELEKAKIPNVANIDPRFMSRAYDAENKFALPYSWTIGGIAVNKTAYPDPVTSWKDLLDNPKVTGKFSLLDDVRETMGAVLKYHGFSVNSTKPDELQKAKATLLAAKKSVKAFTSSPADLLKNGDVVMAHMYSQEALQAKRDTGGKIDFVIPTEGASMAIDNIVILKGAPHPAEAYAFINYIYEMASNSVNVAKIFTGPVVKNVRTLVPADVQNEANLFPTDATFAKTEMLQDLGEATAEYDRIWSEIKAAAH